MNIQNLQTPAILVDLDILEHNIIAYQKLCTSHGKQLWPMVKTHKSTAMARMQLAAGAAGFLCGTLDECEAMAGLGAKNVMLAYPVADAIGTGRAVALADRCHFIARVDGPENARLLGAAADAAGKVIDCTIIVDSGLHRFGIAPADAPALADVVTSIRGLRLAGISTHPGHVYEAANHDAIRGYADDEQNAVKIAVEGLKAHGHTCSIVSSGSTPTVHYSVESPYLTAFHPGNYVFHDAIQLSIGVATENECSLAVLATIISHPVPDRLIVDAGTKCFGLDQGAHGISNIKGYGAVRGHPEILVAGLSEEVAKLKIPADCKLKVGDRIQIIPNHACSSCNLTSYLIGCRKDEVEQPIAVDIRGNSTRKGA